MTKSTIKYFLIFILFLKTETGLADVIFTPRQYSFLCYSAEFTLGLEKSAKPKATNVIWGGAGCVGSFQYFDQPVYGLELAYERRHYFKPDSFKHFFISTYFGTALMTNFNDTKYFGIVPGLKINYKVKIYKSIIAEPYISLSIPFIHDIPDMDKYVPLPVLTIGTRIGLSFLKTKMSQP